MRITQRLRSKTAKEGLLFMALAVMGSTVFWDYAVRDFSTISFSAPLEEIIFDLSLLGAMYSFFLVPIALAAFFGWMLWTRPNG